MSVAFEIRSEYPLQLYAVQPQKNDLSSYVFRSTADLHLISYSQRDSIS